MKIKHFALSAASLLAIFSGVLHADTFEPKGASVGVDYRIPFGGSTRMKAEAPTFGFNFNVTPAQDPLGMVDVRPSLGYKSTTLNKLIDVRFDSKTQAVRNMYVGGVSVLQKVVRVNVDGAPGVVDTVISWPMVAVGFVGFYAWADDRQKIKAAAPAPACVTFSDTSDTSMGIAPCAGFSN